MVGGPGGPTHTPKVRPRGCGLDLSCDCTEIWYDVHWEHWRTGPPRELPRSEGRDGGCCDLAVGAAVIPATAERVQVALDQRSHLGMLRDADMHFDCAGTAPHVSSKSERP